MCHKLWRCLTTTLSESLALVEPTVTSISHGVRQALQALLNLPPPPLLLLLLLLLLTSISEKMKRPRKASQPPSPGLLRCLPAEGVAEAPTLLVKVIVSRTDPNQNFYYKHTKCREGSVLGECLNLLRLTKNIRNLKSEDLQPQLA